MKIAVTMIIAGLTRARPRLSLPLRKSRIIVGLRRRRFGSTDAVTENTSLRTALQT